MMMAAVLAGRSIIRGKRGMTVISLNVSKHCVGTEIKRQYNQRIAAYFKLKDPEDIGRAESAIALLKAALEGIDFGGLRAACPELRGGGRHEVSLSGEGGAILIHINGETIDATHSYPSPP